MIRYAAVIGLGLSLTACSSFGFNGPNQPTTLDLLKEINAHCDFHGQMGIGVGGFAGTGTGGSLTGSMDCKHEGAVITTGALIPSGTPAPPNP